METKLELYHKEQIDSLTSKRDSELEKLVGMLKNDSDRLEIEKKFEILMKKQNQLSLTLGAYDESKLKSDENHTVNNDVAISSLPTEDEVLKTIFDCVFIRGIDLEDYKRDFANEQSGLYTALVKLFNSKGK